MLHRTITRATHTGDRTPLGGMSFLGVTKVFFWDTKDQSDFFGIQNSFWGIQHVFFGIQKIVLDIFGGQKGSHQLFNCS